MTECESEYMYMLNTVIQKTAPFYFCNNSECIETIIGIRIFQIFNKYGTNRYQNRQSLFSGIFLMPGETQRA